MKSSGLEITRCPSSEERAAFTLQSHCFSLCLPWLQRHWLLDREQLYSTGRIRAQTVTSRKAPGTAFRVSYWNPLHCWIQQWGQQVEGGDFGPLLCPPKTPPGSCIQFWGPHLKDMDLLEESRNTSATDTGWESWGCSDWGKKGFNETSEHPPAPNGATREEGLFPRAWGG